MPVKKAGPGLNEERALAIVMNLLAVPGVSCEERDIAHKIIDLLVRAGVPRKACHFDSANLKSPYGGNCGNLIVKLPGTTAGPRRMLIAHMDTVPLCKESKPVRRGGVILSARKGTGVGADNRGGCGAIVAAITEILKNRLPHPPLTLLFTVQEEIGLVGARYVNTRLLGRPELSFNFDGNSPDTVSIGATGGMHIDIDIHGIPSHAGGSPERGVSAAMIEALALVDLQQNGWFGLIVRDGVRGTSNVGIVSGGTATNVVMDHLQLQAECRSYSQSLRLRIAEAYRKAFERAARQIVSSQGRRGSVRFRSIKKYEAFKLTTSDASVREVMRSLHKERLRPVLEYSNGGLDANWLAERGIRAATLGAGSHDAHTSGERLIIDEFLAGCRIALRLATGG